MSREPLRLLSVVLPARDEEGCIVSTVEHLHLELRLNSIPHEIVVVDDGSTDSTWDKLQELAARLPELKPLQNIRSVTVLAAPSFMDSINMTGDAVVIMMADESDDGRDVVRYWQLLNEGWDAVFGSRFIKGGGVIDYPWLKLRVNRLANFFIQFMFNIRLNDTTNAFKAYRASVIEGCRPLLSPHFNLTVELPLKDNCARLSVDGDTYYLAQPAQRRSETEDEGNGQPLSFHLPVCLAGKILQPRRLPPGIGSGRRA